MNLQHLWAIARKEFRHILRDPGTLIMLSIGPILLLLPFVYAITADVKNAPVAVIDEAKNAASTELITRIDNTAVAKVTQHLASVDEADKLFDRDEIRAVVVIPEHYGEMDYYGIPKNASDMLKMLQGNFDTGNIPQIEIIVDGTEPMSAERVVTGVYNVTEAHFRELATKALPAIAPFLDAPVKINSERRYNPDLRNVVDYFPGLAAMVLSLPGIALTLAITNEREHGTLENLVAMPVSRAGMLLGKIVPYLAFGLVDALVMLVVGQVFYDVPFRGNVLQFTVISFFFMVSNMGLGLLISVLVHSQQLAMVVSMLVFFLPSAFFSGIFFPVSAMPWIMQIELQSLPVVHYVILSKAMYLQGASIVTMWFNALMLVVLSIAVLAAAVALFRKKVA